MALIFFKKELLSNEGNNIILINFTLQTSESRKFHQGLPQGSVLAPLLFLFHINNLAEQLTEENQIAMFADDVTILATNKNKQLAEESAQRSINVVFE